jgi:hypothetical protein
LPVALFNHRDQHALKFIFLPLIKQEDMSGSLIAAFVAY